MILDQNALPDRSQSDSVPGHGAKGPRGPHHRKTIADGWGPVRGTAKKYNSLTHPLLRDAQTATGDR